MGHGNVAYGGGIAETVLNPLVLLVVLIAGALILFAPRQKALSAFIAAGILIPIDQVAVIAGVHFPMLRVLVTFGFIRLFREKRPSKTWLFAGGINRLDISIILLNVFVAIDGMILFHNSGAVIYQVGSLYSLIGMYLLLRLLMRNEEDVISAIRTLAYLTIFIAVIMAIEFKTGRNPYAMLGGFRSAWLAHLVARDDKFRAQGPFGHSILAGTFGAVLVPLFWALWWRSRKHRVLAVTAIIGAMVMTITCNSSTPILATAAGIFALSLWRIRNSMSVVRRGIVVTLVVLQIVLKNPVWHLLADIDISGGSSGFHRYMIIDMCIRHFKDWCAFGVQNTGVWGWDMWDLANEFVGVADNSGLIPFIFLIAALVYGFKFLGRARRASMKNKPTAQFIWAIGCALFANIVAFFGISYWDQTQVSWYALLVMISAIVASMKAARRKAELVASAAPPPASREIVEQPVYAAS